MRTAGTRLQEVGAGEEATLIGEEAVPPPPSPPTPRHAFAQSALTGLLFTSLKALSQRTIVALAALVDLALLGSAFALLLIVIAAPTILQLIAVAGYAVFVLVSLVIRQRQ